MVFTSSRSKQGGEVSYKSRKRMCINVNSHINSSESNNLNTSNSDNVTGNSNILCINVQAKNLFNTLLTLQTETDTESSVSINKEIIDENNISE